MFQHVVVPVDGSPLTLAAVVVGSRMAASVNGTLELVAVVDGTADLADAGAAFERVEQLGALPAEPVRHVFIERTVASALACVAQSTPGVTVVMSGAGRARPAALLQQFCGPVVIVGPHCHVDGAGALDGTYVVALDGSIGDEGVIPVVATWTMEFGGTPWLVDVIEPSTRPPDVVESAYVNHRALRLRRRTGCDVEHEILHGDHPARAIVEFAGATSASLIFAGTDADSRMARLRRRAITSGIVRHAMCPVVLMRLPEVRARPKPPPKPLPPPVPPVWSRAWCEQYGPDAVRLRRARNGTPPTSRR